MSAERPISNISPISGEYRKPLSPLPITLQTAFDKASAMSGPLLTLTAEQIVPEHNSVYRYYEKPVQEAMNELAQFRHIALEDFNYGSYVMGTDFCRDTIQTQMRQQGIPAPSQNDLAYLQKTSLKLWTSTVLGNTPEAPISIFLSSLQTAKDGKELTDLYKHYSKVLEPQFFNQTAIRSTYLMEHETPLMHIAQGLIDQHPKVNKGSFMYGVVDMYYFYEPLFAAATRTQFHC